MVEPAAALLEHRSDCRIFQHKNVVRIVSFLEGDPDRPLVTGRVYHEDYSQNIQPPALTEPIVDEENGHEIGVRLFYGGPLPLARQGSACYLWIRKV